MSFSDTNAAACSFSFQGSGDPAGLDLPVALAHFLPWYSLRGDAWPLPESDAETIRVLPAIADLRHWTDPGSGYRRSHLYLPEIGRYDSRDPETIAWQIAMAKSAGIDGFVINWYGCNSVENVMTLHFLAGLERWNRAHPDEMFGYALCLDAQAQLPTEGKVPVTLEEDLVYVRDHLIRPGCLIRDGRPVFLSFPYAASAKEWSDCAARVFGAAGYDLLWSDLGGEEGATGSYLWVRPDAPAMAGESGYSWPDPDDTGVAHARGCYARWAAADSPALYGMAGVWPGFNDMLVTWAWQCPSGSERRRPRLIAQETLAGNTYDLAWQAYLDALAEEGGFRLPLVQIVTWNDHAETSSIEPTREFGRTLLDKTRLHIAEAKRVWQARNQPGID